MQVVIKHDTGMGESYMDGDYEVDNFGGLLAVAVVNANNIEDGRGLLGIANWLGDRLLYLAHLRRPNTVHGSRKNIEEHYDAGAWLLQLIKQAAVQALGLLALLQAWRSLLPAVQAAWMRPCNGAATTITAVLLMLCQPCLHVESPQCTCMHI